MAYNHSEEEKKFKEQQRQNEQLYRECGMTDEQIAAIKEYDERIYKLDRAFYRRTQLIEQPENVTDVILDNHSYTYLEKYWTDFIECEEKHLRIMKVPPIMRKAFYMYKVLGMYQNEIASKLSIPQRTISYWIVKISEILK
ncbi:MAG: hypothetical protein IKH75_00565 [Ruminococcus sp.]|nr:hypothetical protein [Ruminococcus sp.]